MGIRCCLLAAWVGALVAADYEPLHLLSYRETVTIPGHKPLEQVIEGVTLAELPWLAALPRVAVPPPGFDRDGDEDRITLAGKERPVMREEWFRREDDPASALACFERVTCHYDRRFPLPDMVLNLPGLPVYLPAGSLRVVYEERRDRRRPDGQPPIPRCNFTGGWDQATTYELDGRELPAQRFAFTYRWDATRSHGDVITSAAIPGLVCRIAINHAVEGEETAGRYLMEMTATAVAEEPAHLKRYPRAGLAYARPATFVERQPGKGWALSYANPQGIALDLAPHDLGGRPIRAWWEANADRLLADAAPEARARSGFIGFAQNDPLYGYLDADGNLHAWYTHGQRGYRVRITGFDKFDQTALKQLFAGLRYPLPATATQP